MLSGMFFSSFFFSENWFFLNLNNYSLYPFVMKHCGYPIGEPYLLPLKSFETPLKKPEDIYFEGFMNVTVCVMKTCKKKPENYNKFQILPPKQLRLPLLPAKIDDKLFFALCPGEDSKCF